MAIAVHTKLVYDFAEGSRDMRELLGGKGANVAEMTRILGPERVPAGFTITTEACVAYMEADRTEPAGLDDQVDDALARLEESAGRRLGDPGDPLLVSVRSGAPESMPGMLDTVLNLGLSERSVEGLAQATGNDRFAWDSYRRFTQMFGNVCRGIAGERYEDAIAERKREAGVKLDTDLSVEDLKALAQSFTRLYRAETGDDFPLDPREQLRQAIRAVFDSWLGERAVEYRRINRIPDDWGTAVNVQQMVFGNKGEASCSGVAFSRDEITGAPAPSGDFLQNAQGEDVVSGVRSPRPLEELRELMPDAYAELMAILGKLEAHYDDMQDTEFTVEDGRLFMLQTRSAKRPAQAAVRFAVDAVEEGLLTREKAIATIDAASLEALLHETFAPDAEYSVLARGVNASPGAAKGTVVFTARAAVQGEEDRQDRRRELAGNELERFEAENPGFILVRPFTEADDVAGFYAARGILTSEGGKASHAALVARGMGKPCVCGASALEIDVEAGKVHVDGTVLHEGDRIAIDGTTGVVTVDDVPLVEPEFDERFETVLKWADGLRRLGVRANADDPDAAAKSRAFGAEGIGLCRTEHMFLGEERSQLVKEMFLAAEPWRRARAALDRADDAGLEQARADFEASDATFKSALAAMQELQQEDFEAIFRAMEGMPVTVRLLDPPLHEFLPLHEFQALVESLGREGGPPNTLQEAERRLALVEQLHEANPMLGTRGTRLGIMYPPIYEMQIRAILGALAKISQEGEPPTVEIMIPLVAYERELRLMRDQVEQVAEQSGYGHLPFNVGTMIELPRACFVADRIATVADFFSFGTNDLTQTALGMSRDDTEGNLLARYIDRGIVDRSPFETLDTAGVGWLIRLAAWNGRKANPALKLGVCGEHGGDPDSVAFFEEAGLDYVSCSPYRVPIARVAAAQAATA